jgi:hypothetical protein
MCNRIWIATLVLGSLVFAPLPAAAQRPYLWWATRTINANGVNTCLSIAQTAMNGQGLHDVQRDAVGVAGVTEKSYAIITCVAGSNQRVTAVIMVASNDRAESEQVMNGLADRIVRIRGL